MKPESEEVRLLIKIGTLPAGAERDILIDQLEVAPIQYRTFCERWLVVHDIGPWNCWSDKGYDPSKSRFPRDVQILAASQYGNEDIKNGGLHQFFGNHTGGFAPEMAEWLERSGLKDAALIVREAMRVFGPEFPRSQMDRRQFLARFTGATREERDPFHKLDNRYYTATEDEVFEQAANNWLRDVCGIKRLKDGF